MAAPFYSEVLQCFPIAANALAFCLTTNASYSDAADFRVLLYSDEARTTLVGTGNTATGSGSARERLKSVVGGLTANTVYYPVVQYRAVTTVDPWVEISAASTNSFYKTMPNTGTFVIDWYSDPHLTVANMATDERHGNFIMAVTNTVAHLAFCGGDLTFNSDEGDAWHIARLSFEETLLRYRPFVGALGNWEFRTDPTNSANFPAGYTNTDFEGYDATALSWLMGYRTGDANTARETFGVIENDLAKFIWVEPFSGSGLQTDTEVTYNSFLGAYQWQWLQDQINSNTKPWLLVHTHNPLNETQYSRPRGYAAAPDGSQETQLHTILAAHFTENVNCVGVIRMLGHNHRFFRQRWDGVEYLECGSTRNVFTYSDADLGAFGYNGNEVRVEEGFAGFVRLSLTATGGTAEFIRTTSTPLGGTAEADSTVLHTIDLTANPFVRGDDSRADSQGDIVGDESL